MISLWCQCQDLPGGPRFGFNCLGGHQTGTPVTIHAEGRLIPCRHREGVSWNQAPLFHIAVPCSTFLTHKQVYGRKQLFLESQIHPQPDTASEATSGIGAQSLMLATPPMYHYE